MHYCDLSRFFLLRRYDGINNIPNLIFTANNTYVLNLDLQQDIRACGVTQSYAQYVKIYNLHICMKISRYSIKRVKMGFLLRQKVKSSAYSCVSSGLTCFPAGGASYSTTVASHSTRLARPRPLGIRNNW